MTIIEFMHEHPILTFFIALMLLGTLSDVARYAFGA